MNPIIGIISRKSLSEKGHHISYIYDDIVTSIIKNKGIPIGVPCTSIESYINICDGFILQGGDDIVDSDLDIIKYLYEKNIPLLGICLGMQEMAYLFDGQCVDIKGHDNNCLHEITIKENSLLEKILNCHKTIVNTRHKSVIKNTSLTVNAISSEGYIEGVEDKSKKFFLGVEWHPENMTKIDINSNKIFTYFIDICRQK